MVADYRPRQFMGAITALLGHDAELYERRMAIPEMNLRFSDGEDHAALADAWTPDDYFEAIRAFAPLTERYETLHAKEVRLANYVQDLRVQRDSLLSVIEQYERSFYESSPVGVEAAKRRARRKASAEHFTRSEWNALRAFCNFTCLSCGRREPEIELVADHVKALADGGDDSIHNIQPLCRQCNGSKHTKHIDYRPQFGASPCATE